MIVAIISITSPAPGRSSRGIGKFRHEKKTGRIRMSKRLPYAPNNFFLQHLGTPWPMQKTACQNIL